MPEANNSNLEKRHTPEAVEFLTPIYVYNDTILQFKVLQQMGYPVTLQELTSSDIPEALYLGDEVFQYWRNTYLNWARPVILDPAFEDWVELPDTPGDQINVGDLDELISGHPMQIVSEVDKGEAGLLRYYLEELELNGSIPHIYPHNEGIVTKELLERCIVAAFERIDEKMSSEDTLDYIPILDENTINLYNQLVTEGTSAVTPEELMALYYDYYKLVERLCPEFISFKKTTPPTSE